MGLLSRAASWLGGGSAATTPNPGEDYWYDTFPVPTGAGIKVTADVAIKCSAVWACVSLIADTLSTSHLGVYRLKIDGNITGGMDLDPSHPLSDVLSMVPNARQTPAEFWGQMLFHAVLRGEAFAEIHPGPRGFADRLEVIHPDTIVRPIEVLPDGTLRYKVRDPKTGITRILLQQEVLRIPGITSDGVNGLRTIDTASEVVALAVAADQNAARVFSNGLNIGAVITHPGKLTKEAIERLEGRLGAKFSGIGNLHRPAILQENMTITRIAQTAAESQLLEARRWQIGEIARHFGRVPMHLLGIDETTNRATVEEQWRSFIRTTIRPWAEKVEQAIRRDLILAARRYVAVFDLDDVERGNMAAQATYNSAALGSGGSPAWMTVNEVRRRAGLNPYTEAWADELAQGTNPQQGVGTTPAPKPKNGAGTVEGGLLSMGHALVRKEVTAVRRFATRYADDTIAFRKAVNAFYGGFVTEVASKLGVTKDQARAWCRGRAERVGGANDVAGTIDSLESELETAADTASSRATSSRDAQSDLAQGEA